MQDDNHTFETLIAKLEKLGKKFHSQSEILKSLEIENKKLKENINKYKSEIEALRREKNRQNQGDKAGDNITSESLKAELEIYIEELNSCIEKLKKL